MDMEELLSVAMQQGSPSGALSKADMDMLSKMQGDDKLPAADAGVGAEDAEEQFKKALMDANVL